MNKEIHMFDLDGTLWNIHSEIWVIDKEKPYKPIIKINNFEFSLIKNGIYKGDNILLDYNGNKFFISKEIWNKIYIKRKSENTNRFGISFKNFYNKKDLNKTKIDYKLDNIEHLRGKENIDIGLLTSRSNINTHSDIINELRLKLKDMGLPLNKIYFVGDKFDLSNNNINNFKKVNILLEHLIGFKIKDNKFISMRQDWYPNVFFYDNCKINIDYANNIQSFLNEILSKTDNDLFNIIIDRINSNDIKLNNNLITNNIRNRFKNTIISIKEPNKFPIQMEKIITKFNNYKIKN
jgi:hypothetical protein